MFWNRKKKNESQVITTITKTSEQALHELKVKQIVDDKRFTCPNCGFKCEANSNLFGYRIECSDTKGYNSKCIKCGTEWKTEYNY